MHRQPTRWSVSRAAPLGFFVETQRASRQVGQPLNDGSQDTWTRRDVYPRAGMHNVCRRFLWVLELHRIQQAESIQALGAHPDPGQAGMSRIGASPRATPEVWRQSLGWRSSARFSERLEKSSTLFRTQKNNRWGERCCSRSGGQASLTCNVTRRLGARLLLRSAGDAVEK